VIVYLYRVYVEKEQTESKFDAQLTSEGVCNPFKIWIGKDYVNFIFKDFCDLDNPFLGVFCPYL